MNSRLRKHEYLIWVAAGLNLIQVRSIEKAQYFFIIAIERFVTYDMGVGGFEEVVTVVLIHDELKLKGSSENVVLDGEGVEA